MYFLQAVYEGDVGKVAALLRGGHKKIDVRDQHGRSSLHIAASHSREDLLLLLLSSGADVSAVDQLGNTPLHYCGHIDAIEVLVNHGADIFAKNRHGDQPLTLMTRRGLDKDTVQFMKKLMKEESEMNVSAVELPLLGRRSASIELQKQKRQTAQDVWQEFCTDLGPARLAALLALILILSLLVAFTVTGLSVAMDKHVPILVNQQTSAGSEM